MTTKLKEALAEVVKEINSMSNEKLSKALIECGDSSFSKTINTLSLFITYVLHKRDVKDVVPYRPKGNFSCVKNKV